MNITASIVRELLHYDPGSGVFTWKERHRDWFRSDRSFRAWNTRFPGKRAGHIWTSKPEGYQCRRIKLLRSERLEHRLAWLYMTDDPLPEQLDHINRNATDNRWLNLRSSTHSENARNQSMRLDNTSGVTGISWSAREGKWHARCRMNGKLNHIGYFDDLAEASRAVAAFYSDNGFREGHGAETAHYHRKDK